MVGMCVIVCVCMCTCVPVCLYEKGFIHNSTVDAEN